MLVLVLSQNLEVVYSINGQVEPELLVNRSLMEKKVRENLLFTLANLVTCYTS